MVNIHVNISDMLAYECPAKYLPDEFMLMIDEDDTTESFQEKISSLYEIGDWVGVGQLSSDGKGVVMRRMYNSPWRHNVKPKKGAPK